MTEDIEWGRGLTGPFMKSLNLPGDTPVKGCGVRAYPYRDWNFARESDTYHLPADHFVYTVLAYNEKRGTSFVPWAGCDNAPDDWDGGECLFGCGACWVPAGPVSFEQHDLIIGYTRKDSATDDDGEYVRIKKMTAKEWDALVAGRAASWARELGIITETPVERFKRENPGLSADDLLAKALEGGASSCLSGAEVQHG